MADKMNFGIIIGNRSFFPDSLAKDGRGNLLDALKKAGHGTVAPNMKMTKFGAVETFEDAKQCAALFDENRAKIDGIIISLPNFGDEKGAAEAVKRSGLNVPILVHAEPDAAAKMTNADRRDAFCGKISVCNNLRQAGIPYSLTDNHTIKVSSKEFADELERFAAVCRIVKGLKNARFGAIGARTGAFNTVRYSEKILEDTGIAVETVDLSEMFGMVERLKDSDGPVKTKLKKINEYLPTKNFTPESIIKMAKFGVVVDRWIKDNEIDGTAIQCWTAVQEYFGISPCTLMSMMSESLLPSACEVDIMGLLSMYVLQLASGRPSAILDWNNNYGTDKDKAVLFHCSNVPRSYFTKPDSGRQDIVGGTVGMDKACGTIIGKFAPAKFTFFRATTDDREGLISCYLGSGEFTNDKLDTFGGYGVMKIPNLQILMQYICRMGFEHHVAVNRSLVADAVTEAVSNYLGWELYRHV